jgi:hypothetical protein
VLKIRQLAIELLTQDDGISEAAYELLVGFLDTEMRRQVKATDGRFYLPENFKDGESPLEEQDVKLTYLENLIQQILPGASFETDNDDQLVIYTDKMLDVDNVVDFVPNEDEECDDEDE